MQRQLQKDKQRVEQILRPDPSDQAAQKTTSLTFLGPKSPDGRRSNETDDLSVSSVLQFTGSCTAATAHLAQLRGQIESDKRAIRRLGFKNRDSEFEEWDNLAEDAQKRFEGEVRDALTDIALSRALSAIGSLNPPKANRLITQFRRLGVDEPYIFEAIGKLGSIPDKHSKLEAAKKVLDYTKGLVKSARAENSDEKLEGLADMMGVIETDPRLAFLLTDLKFAAASVYAGAAGQISRYYVLQLTALNEQDLKNLKRLSGALEKDVKQLKSAKGDPCLQSELK